MKKIQDAQKMLLALGLPKAQQNEMAALTLLALAGIKPRDAWQKATRRSLTVTKGVMAFIAQYYRKDYAPNTRETVRRQVLHQFVQAHIADYNPDDSTLPTNSPRAHYALSSECLGVLQAWKTPNQTLACDAFIQTHGSLLERFQNPRRLKQVPLTLPDGTTLHLSPGNHNAVQIKVLEEFGPRFAPGATLLYFGDTAKKNLYYNDPALKTLGIRLNKHDKLPDILLYWKAKNWLYLIEVVTSHGPMSPKRVTELKAMFAGTEAGLVFVSAFPDLTEFRKHLKEIAWETEVWIADIPDHLIHYNGDRFLGPHV